MAYLLDLEDAMIAATALVRDLRVATRNTADFKRFGVKLVNPFTSPTVKWITQPATRFTALHIPFA